MTETRGHLTGRVRVLAALDLALGGGLLLGAIAVFPLRDIPAITYAQRMTAFRIAFWIGVAASVTTALGFVLCVAKQWLSARLVTAAGTISVASIAFQIGLFGRWSPIRFLILLCIGVTILIAGLAIGMGRRWAGYLAVVIAAAPLVAFTSAVFAGTNFSLDMIDLIAGVIGGLIVLLPVLAVLDPVIVFFGLPEGGGFHRVARTAFALFIFLALALSILIATATGSVMAAQQRRLQRRTIANMYEIHAAIDKYSDVNKVYPAAANVAELARLLEPKYIPTMPRQDGWGFPIEYHHVMLRGVEGFVIRSAGCDGIFEQKDPTAYPGGGVIGFERDIVTSTVSESQWPEGDMPP